MKKCWLSRHNGEKCILCYIIVINQDEDGDWLAHFVELPNVSAFADSNWKHCLTNALALKRNYERLGKKI